MDERINRLNEIDNNVSIKTKEVLSIQKQNYPLDNRNFLPKDDYQKVITLDKEVKALCSEYFKIYNSLDSENKRKYKFKNLTELHYKMTQNNNSLELANVKDENSVHNSLNKAYEFGKDAIKNLVISQKNGDKETFEKNRKILIACENILNQHDYGVIYKNKLMRYEKRIISGRAIHDDISDYQKLILQTKELARQYAQAIQRGASEEEMKNFYQTFENAFKKEEELLEFVPDEMIGENKVNLHILKTDAEQNPQNLYNANNYKRL